MYIQYFAYSVNDFMNDTLLVVESWGNLHRLQKNEFSCRMPDQFGENVPVMKYVSWGWSTLSMVSCT